MSDSVGIGPQLPPNSTGDITGAFPVTVDGTSILVPATVIVDSSGNEAVAGNLRALRSSMNDIAFKAFLASERSMFT